MRILNPNQDSNTKKKIWDTKDLSNSRSFSVLEKQQIIAEITYVLQPLLHLSSIGFFGFNSWVPWMVSFSCDVIRYVSQRVHRQHVLDATYDELAKKLSLFRLFFSHALHWTHLKNLTPSEQKEMLRRRYDMLIYLLRSPFYDHHTKKLILTILLMAKKAKVPFANVISDFLMAYLPHYRKIYAYLWFK